MNFPKRKLPDLEFLYLKFSIENQDADRIVLDIII